MNLNIHFFLLCPLSEDQKPINEYIELLQNYLLNKVLYKFFFPVFFLFISAFRITFLQNSFINWFLTNFIISISFFLLFLFFIYFRWLEIDKRFNNARLFYEEGSWYDGQIWEKPLLLIKNDLLLSKQKIKPRMKKISNSILLVFFLLLSFLTFLFCFEFV